MRVQYIYYFLTDVAVRSPCSRKSNDQMLKSHIPLTSSRVLCLGNLSIIMVVTMVKIAPAPMLCIARIANPRTVYNVVISCGINCIVAHDDMASPVSSSPPISRRLTPTQGV